MTTIARKPGQKQTKYWQEKQHAYHQREKDFFWTLWLRFCFGCTNIHRGLNDSIYHLRPSVNEGVVIIVAIACSLTCIFCTLNHLYRPWHQTRLQRWWLNLITHMHIDELLLTLRTAAHTHRQTPPDVRRWQLQLRGSAEEFTGHWLILCLPDVLHCYLTFYFLIYVSRSMESSWFTNKTNSWDGVPALKNLWFSFLVMRNCGQIGKIVYSYSSLATVPLDSSTCRVAVWAILMILEGCVFLACHHIATVCRWSILNDGNCPCVGYFFRH